MDDLNGKIAALWAEDLREYEELEAAPTAGPDAGVSSDPAREVQVLEDAAGFGSPSEWVEDATWLTGEEEGEELRETVLSSPRSVPEPGLIGTQEFGPRVSGPAEEAGLEDPRVRFSFDGGRIPELPPTFALVSVGTGPDQEWPPDWRTRDDEALRAKLAGRGIWHLRTYIHWPDRKTAEPAWCVKVPVGEARRLGREFRREEIFWVEGDILNRTGCAPGSSMDLMGSFRVLVDGGN